MPLNISDTKKFHGTYRGIVVNNKDPEGHRRVQVQIPMLSDGITSNWAWPRFTSGQRAAIPAVGEGVWIDFEAGDPAYPIWTGTYGKNQAANKQIAINPLADTVVTTDINDILKIDSKGDGTKEIDLTTTVANLTRQHFYGSFYNSQTQTTQGAMVFNVTEFSKGVSITNNSRITIKYPGIYNITFSAQMAKTDSGRDFAEIWLRENGQDVPWSGGEIHLDGNDPRLVASWNYFVQCTAPNQYWELMWYSADTAMQLLATAPGSRPGVPSVAVTVNQVR